MSRSTPWGAAQHETKYAPGIVFVSTSSHGGFILSGDAAAHVRKLFPDFKTFAGGDAYEEDCDFAIVIIAFPHLFNDEKLYAAWRSIEVSATWDGASESYCRVHFWLTSSHEAEGIRQRVKAFRAAIAEKWTAGSMGTSGAKWRVWFTHNTTGKSAAVTMDYPSKRFYTTAELTAIDPAFAA